MRSYEKSRLIYLLRDWAVVMGVVSMVGGRERFIANASRRVMASAFPRRIEGGKA
jgi:hypothetical protein